MTDKRNNSKFIRTAFFSALIILLCFLLYPCIAEVSLNNGMNSAFLSQESMIINNSESHVYKYLWHIISGAVIVFEALFIVWLICLLSRQKILRKEAADEAADKEKILQQSELKYRTLSETVSIGIWHINSSGYTEYVNSAMCRLLEIDSADELDGVYFMDFFAPESIETAKVETIKRFKGESSTYEAVIVGKKGTKRTAFLSGAPLLDENRNIIGRIGSFADITELKRTQTELESWIRRYNMIVTASGQVVYEYITSTNEITWGKSIEAVLGFSSDEMKGGFEQWKELLHPDDFDSIVSSLAGAEKSCSFWDERYRMRHKNGHYVWIRDRGFFIPDDSGKAWCQIGMMEDITFIKQSEDLIDFERRQLLSIFDSIDQIIYVSDPSTYEILFANKRLREQLGRDPIGGLCYMELHGYGAPCSFCSNSTILTNGGVPYKWEHFNSEQNQTVDITDRIIRWPDGRDVRFEIAIDITERKRAEEALRESEEKYRAMVNAIPDMIFVFNREFVFTDFRAADTGKLLLPPDHFIGKSIIDVLPTDLAELTSRNIEKVLDSGLMQVYQYSLKFGDSTRYYESRMALKSNEEVLAIVRDVTESKESDEERVRLQMQLLQTQKIESVGRLAGGIAHDFNNMLGAITGYTELALRKIETDNPLRRYLEEILKTAGRSADLTRQLLAFARQQVIEPKIINLNNTVEGMLTMLRRLIGENIDLSWMPGSDLWLVNVDPAQMDQILANLTINARDAINGGGTISIETMNAAVNKGHVQFADNMQPGDYVVLSVSDTGSGMDSATKEKIFEPFFTTKEMGHGTGLGLATVYGIVKQNKGFIYVYSEPGHGSSFKIYFPGIRGENSSPGKVKDEIIPLGCGETVLLAEDEPELMEITKSILEDLNYSVLTAGSPGEALSISDIYSGNLDILITDIIMPQMNGKELANEVGRRRPGLKTLFMSGYTADVIARQGVIDEGINFIQKPFTISDLALKIKEVLEGK